MRSWHPIADCFHLHTERCLCVDDIWYRVCKSCGAIQADGLRHAAKTYGELERSTDTFLTGLTDRILRTLED